MQWSPHNRNSRRQSGVSLYRYSKTKITYIRDSETCFLCATYAPPLWRNSPSRSLSFVQLANGCKKETQTGSRFLFVFAKRPVCVSKAQHSLWWCSLVRNHPWPHSLNEARGPTLQVIFPNPDAWCTPGRVESKQAFHEIVQKRARTSFRGALITLKNHNNVSNRF